MRWAAAAVFRVTRSPRAAAIRLRIDGWVDREEAAELTAQFWDVERRHSAVARNAVREERRRQRRL